MWLVNCYRLTRTLGTDALNARFLDLLERYAKVRKAALAYKP